MVKTGVTKEQFAKIKLAAEKNGFLDSIGWAVWEEKDVSLLPDFSDPSLLSRLRPDCIIIGFNASFQEGEGRPFGAFHCRHRGGRDAWLAEAVKGTSFEGAYMTDLFKIPETDSRKLKDRLRNNPAEEKKQIDALKKELDLLAPAEERKVVCVGRDAFLYFNRNKVPAAQVVSVPHFASFGIEKKEFVSSFRKKVRLLSDGSVDEKRVGKF